MNPLNVTSSVLHYCGAETLHIKQSLWLLQSGLIREGAEKELCEKKWKIKAEAVKKGLNYQHVQYANEITLSLTASFMSIITASLQGSN